MADASLTAVRVLSIFEAVSKASLAIEESLKQASNLEKKYTNNEMFSYHAQYKTFRVKTARGTNV